MPEGPEIRREAEAIRAALEGNRARSVFLAPQRLRRYRRELEGKQVTAVRARGKAILISFSSGRTLYSHNQLYGRWIVCANGETPATGRQLRVAIEGAKKRALLYSASDIAVLKTSGLERHRYLRSLGPDLLNERVTRKVIEARLELPQFQKRSLASLFLDQGFLAGIGNYLRSEILFFAGVHPGRSPGDLSPRERAALATAIRTIVTRSFKTRGITNDPVKAAELEALGWEREEFRFAVFDRDGGTCFECGGAIVRAKIAGRRCYFCPACQPPS